MLSGSTSPGLPSQGYKELPIILHQHWGKECRNPSDPGSRAFLISAVSHVVTLSVQAARLQEGISSSETFLRPDTWA